MSESSSCIMQLAEVHDPQNTKERIMMIISKDGQLSNLILVSLCTIEEQTHVSSISDRSRTPVSVTFKYRSSSDQMHHLCATPSLFLFHLLCFTLSFFHSLNLFFLTLLPSLSLLHALTVSSSTPNPQFNCIPQGAQLAMRQLFSDPVAGVYVNGRTSYGTSGAPPPGPLGMIRFNHF